MALDFKPKAKKDEPKINNTSEPIEPAKFISYLFSCRTALHIMHLKTDSYAKHKALNKLYDNLLDITDSIAEKTSGCMGKHLTGFVDFPVAEYQDDDPLTYIKEIKGYVQKDRYYHFPKDYTPIQNIIDELVSELDEALYLLSLK